MVRNKAGQLLSPTGTAGRNTQIGWKDVASAFLPSRTDWCSNAFCKFWSQSARQSFQAQLWIQTVTVCETCYCQSILPQVAHLHYVVDIDIKGFFDNIDHGKLLKQLWTLGIEDKSCSGSYRNAQGPKSTAHGVPAKERRRGTSLPCWPTWFLTNWTGG